MDVVNYIGGGDQRVYDKGRKHCEANVYVEGMRVGQRRMLKE